jgi:hypothetical protein
MSNPSNSFTITMHDSFESFTYDDKLGICSTIDFNCNVETWPVKTNSLNEALEYAEHFLRSINGEYDD